MYFNYTLFKLYVYANIFFIAQVWVLGKGPVSFWGASKFLGGPVSFQIYWPPGPLHPQAECQGLGSDLRYRYFSKMVFVRTLAGAWLKLLPV